MVKRAPVRVHGPLPPPVHGAARVTALVAEELRSRGARLELNDSNDAVDAPRRAWRLLRGLLRLLVARRGSVYVGGAGGELLHYQALVVAIARRRGLRVVFHHHNSSYLDEPQPAMERLVRWGGPGVRHVVLGDVMAERLRRTYPGATDVVVCSNAALLAAAGPPSPARERDRPVLGHLSNLTLDKGLREVVDTALRAQASGIACTLVLAGPCVDDAARAVVADARERLGDALVVTGPLDQAGVERFYADVDLFLFPSRYRNEAEPLVVLDALRHGVEAVVLDVGCLSELAAPGLVVPLDGDLPGVVLDLLRTGLPDGADARARFTARRERALEARADLLDHLLGAS